jgi:broad specificity phosphatase PhoE
MTSEPVPAASRADANNLSTATDRIVPRGGGGTLARVPAADSTPHRHEQHTQLLVVRHGQSEWNASGRWQGQADPPLDRAGQLQAAAAAEVLGTFDAVWASDLQRATLTARIIAELLGIGPVQIDPRLRETDVGPWQGLTRVEVEAGWPGYLAERRRPDGFEPYDLAAARLQSALSDIAAEHPGGQVLVITHGGVIRALRRSLGSSDPHMPNLSGSWIHAHGPGRLRAGDVVSLLAEPEPTASDVL